jgi:hypothetical protein
MKILKRNAKGDAAASGAQAAAKAGVAIAGAAAGTAIGRAGLLAGIAATFYGIYSENEWITAAGLGAAAGGFAGDTTRVNGLEGMIEDLGDLGNPRVSAARERLRNFSSNLRRRLYLGSAEDELGFPGEYRRGRRNRNWEGLEQRMFLSGAADDVHDLLADFRDAANEMLDVAGLGNVDDEAELLGELAELAEAIQVAISEEGQIVQGLSGEDAEDLLDATDEVIEAAIHGLNGLDDVEDILAEIGDIMGWDELAGDEMDGDEMAGAADKAPIFAPPILLGEAEHNLLMGFEPQLDGLTDFNQRLVLN